MQRSQNMSGDLSFTLNYVCSIRVPIR